MDCTTEQLNFESLSLRSDIVMSYRESGRGIKKWELLLLEVLQHLWSRFWIRYNSFEVYIRFLELLNPVGCSCLGRGVLCSELLREESESKLLVEFYFPRFLTAKIHLKISRVISRISAQTFGLLQAAWNPSQARSFGYFYICAMIGTADFEKFLKGWLALKKR